MIQKQGEVTLFSGTYKGHELIIHEMIRDLVLKGDMLGKPYYCSYVEVLPEDYYYNRPDEAENELNVYGGITWSERYADKFGQILALPYDKQFVGFDTAHPVQPLFTLETVRQVCFSLIDQIIEKNGEMK